MRFLQVITVGFLLAGCGVSNITFNSKVDKKNKIQYYENKQCSYYIGPFNIENKLDIEKLIVKTVQKANKNGLYGNELINIKIQKSGYTAILFTKYCLYIQGNIVYTKGL